MKKIILVLFLFIVLIEAKQQVQHKLVRSSRTQVQSKNRVQSQTKAQTSSQMSPNDIKSQIQKQKIFELKLDHLRRQRYKKERDYENEFYRLLHQQQKKEQEEEEQETLEQQEKIISLEKDNDELSLQVDKIQKQEAEISRPQPKNKPIQSFSQPDSVDIIENSDDQNIEADLMSAMENQFSAVSFLQQDIQYINPQDLSIDEEKYAEFQEQQNRIFEQKQQDEQYEHQLEEREYEAEQQWQKDFQQNKPSYWQPL